MLTSMTELSKTKNQNQMQKTITKGAQSMNYLYEQINAFLLLDDYCKINRVNFSNAVTSLLYNLTWAISSCEDCGIPREPILENLKSIRQICSRSSFLNRLQTWPRGYQGDFETVEYFCYSG